MEQSREIPYSSKIMIRYIITKILNKYKLYLCLIVGIVSIVMVFAMIMMFRDGSCNKLIQRGFTSQREVTKKYPMTISWTGEVLKNELSELPENTSCMDYIVEDIEAYENTWHKYLEYPEIKSAIEALEKDGLKD